VLKASTSGSAGLHVAFLFLCAHARAPDAERGESLPEVGSLVSPAAAEREAGIEVLEIVTGRERRERAARLVPVEPLPDGRERSHSAQLAGRRSEDRPARLEGDRPAIAADALAFVLADLDQGASEAIDPARAGDDEEDAAGFFFFEAPIALGDPVAEELLLETLEGLGAAIPLE
jgi:hypothetical protein